VAVVVAAGVIIIQDHHAVWEALAAAAMGKMAQPARMAQQTQAVEAAVVDTLEAQISRVERAVAVS
jgi:hypothetical protein